MKIKQFEIYRTWLKQWRWRAKGMNNEILASGEAYKNKQDCLDVIDAFQVFRDIPVVFK